MVLLGVDGEVDLKDWEFWFRYGSSDLFACFREPDMENEITAIVSLPQDPAVFKRLRLL